VETVANPNNDGLREGEGALNMATRMTDVDIERIERELAEVLGTDHCDVADFACRALIRTLAELKAARRELAVRPPIVAVVDHNLGATAQSM
jgi:uncharacterized protein (DUF3084 family)